MKTTEPKARTSRIKYRRHDWYDAKANAPKFGIQAQIPGEDNRWLNCAKGNQPLLFDTEEERDAELKALRKEARP